MKYLGVLLGVVMMFTFGCKSDKVEPISAAEQLVIDLELIDSWLAENAIKDVLVHSTNIRYTINQHGSGDEAKVADVLRVSYEGRFLVTGEVFDSNNSFDFVLNSGRIISGWYHMLQEMKEGDEITIYLPSKYGYGSSGNIRVLPNTVLVFDIKLIRVGI